MYMGMTAIFVSRPEPYEQAYFHPTPDVEYDIWLQLAQGHQRSCLKMLMTEPVYPIRFPIAFGSGKLKISVTNKK